MGEDGVGAWGKRMSMMAQHGEAPPGRTAAGAMSNRTRVAAAFKGMPVDRVPVSFWLHFPGRDHTAALLAEQTVAQQRRFDLDLVKLMPTGMYPVMDYGVKVAPSEDDLGTTRYVSGPITRPDEWRTLPRVSPEQGVLAREVEVVRLVRAALGPDVPILHTIFGPLSMAAKLVGGALTPELLGSPFLEPALQRMAGDVVAFGRACLAAGADGFYFATQLANRTFDAAAYERLGVPYDLMVLEALRPESWGIILHLHGEQPRFDLADRYPIDAVSWEDRDSAPSLAEAVAQTSRCLVGGVGRADPLAYGTAGAVAAQVHEAIARTGGRRLIVAPGCVVPVTAPEENLRAMVAAVSA
jgi:uroporphyrinogen decarboxylase